MSREIIFRSYPIDRRKPLLKSSEQNCSGGSRRFAEVAGVTTAGCAAIACCPGGVATLLFLAVYKVPAGLCRKAIKMNRRRRLLKKGLLPSRSQRCDCRLLKKGLLPSRSQGCDCGCDDSEWQIHEMSCRGPMVLNSLEMDEDAIEFEKEMWDRFYSTGFWRSLSQRGADQQTRG